MSPVDLDGVEAGVARVAGRDGEVIGHTGQLIGGQRVPRRLPQPIHTRGAHGRDAIGVATLGALVPQLGGDHGARGVHGTGHAAPSREYLVAGQGRHRLGVPRRGIR